MEDVPRPFVTPLTVSPSWCFQLGRHGKDGGDKYSLAEVAGCIADLDGISFGVAEKGQGERREAREGLTVLPRLPVVLPTVSVTPRGN